MQRRGKRAALLKRQSLVVFVAVPHESASLSLGVDVFVP